MRKTNTIAVSWKKLEEGNMSPTEKQLRGPGTDRMGRSYRIQAREIQFNSKETAAQHPMIAALFVKLYACFSKADLGHLEIYVLDCIRSQ